MGTGELGFQRVDRIVVSNVSLSKSAPQGPVRISRVGPGLRERILRSTPKLLYVLGSGWCGDNSGWDCSVFAGAANGSGVFGQVLQIKRPQRIGERAVPAMDVVVDEWNHPLHIDLSLSGLARGFFRGRDAGE